MGRVPYVPANGHYRRMLPTNVIDERYRRVISGVVILQAMVEGYVLRDDFETPF